MKIAGVGRVIGKQIKRQKFFRPAGLGEQKGNNKNT